MNHNNHASALTPKSLEFSIEATSCSIGSISVQSRENSSD